MVFSYIKTIPFDGLFVPAPLPLTCSFWEGARASATSGKTLIHTNDQ